MKETLNWWSTIIVWLKRATGINYSKFPPPRIVVYSHEMDNMKVSRTKAEAVKQDAVELENTVFNVLKKRFDGNI